MAGAKGQGVGNKWVAGLRPRAQSAFLGRCAVVQLTYGDILCEIGTPLTHVYFAMKGFILRIAVLDDKHPLDMSLIGDEDMLGAIMALDVRAAPMRAGVHGEGAMMRMSAPADH